MADTLVERVTGQAEADAVPVEVQLVLSDDALLGRSDECAHLPGYGPVPAAMARSWVRASSAAQVWLRRLYARPATGELVAMESRRRLFDGSLRRLIVARDQTCRTPWCDAPIRHLDHVAAATAGGATSAANGQGLCEQCNYAKTAPGWTAEPSPGPRHTVQTTTPTGHRHASTAPPLRDTARDPAPTRAPATNTPRSRPRNNTSPPSSPPDAIDVSAPHDPESLQRDVAVLLRWKRPALGA